MIFQTALYIASHQRGALLFLYIASHQRGALLFLTFPFDSQVKGAFLCQQQM